MLAVYRSRKVVLGRLLSAESNPNVRNTDKENSPLRQDSQGYCSDEGMPCINAKGKKEETWSNHPVCVTSDQYPNNVALADLK